MAERTSLEQVLLRVWSVKKWHTHHDLLGSKQGSKRMERPGVHLSHMDMSERYIQVEGIRRGVHGKFNFQL